MSDKYPFTIEVPAENVWLKFPPNGGYVHDECYNWGRKLFEDRYIFRGIFGGKVCRFSFMVEEEAALFKTWWG